MKQSVMIKGNAYGITVVLDPQIPFPQLKEDVSAKFRESASFFKNAKMAVSFEGRPLTDEEQMELAGL